MIGRAAVDCTKSEDNPPAAAPLRFEVFPDPGVHLALATPRRSAKLEE